LVRSYHRGVLGSLNRTKTRRVFFDTFGEADFRFERFGQVMGLVVGWKSGCG
jgi:hypothetical protein